MRDEHLACRLANDDSIAACDLEKGRQFFVPYSNEWLRFWICDETGFADQSTPEDLDFEFEGGGHEHWYVVV